MVSKYILITFMAFLFESVDSSLGMGYGTILTPTLLFLGYDPLEVVPLVLLSEFITGLLSALMHHKTGNVNLKVGSKGFKVSLVLAVCSIIGTVSAAYLALELSQNVIKGYIAFLLLGIGVSTFLTINRKIGFSWFKIFSLGIVASFNKGLSGGGYGPLVTGGQILSGLNGKNAVGITSLSEGLTCLVGVVTYFTLNANNLDWYMGIALISGALLSIPVAVKVVKIINEKHFRRIISFSIIALGMITFYKTFSSLFCLKNLPLIAAAAIVTIPFAYHWGRSRQEDQATRLE